MYFSHMIILNMILNGRFKL